MHRSRRSGLLSGEPRGFTVSTRKSWRDTTELGGYTINELAKLPRKKRGAIILKAMRDVLKPRKPRGSQ